MSANFAVIPMRDQWEYTRDLVDQLRDQGETDEIIICDNGSIEDASHAFLAEQYALDCEGWNLHEMWNYGIATALTLDRQPNVAILNNDLRIGPEFMSTLARGLRAHDNLWVVCPNYDRREMPAAMVQIHNVCGGKYDGTGGLAGFAFMVKGEMFGNTLPWFDENLAWYCGDAQLILEVDRRGGLMAMIDRTWVEHLDGGSRTLRTRPPEFQAVLDADVAYFKETYGVEMTDL